MLPRWFKAIWQLLSPNSSQFSKICKNRITRQENWKVDFHLKKKIDVKTLLKLHLFQEWKRIWENVSTTNKLQNIKPSAEFWTTALRTTRREEVSLCRLRISRARITHSHLLTKVPLPLCKLCSGQITVQHLLIECSLYRNYRIKFNLPSFINSS